MNAVLLALLQVTQQPASKPMEYLRFHRDADAALVAGKLDEARTGFQHCLAISPVNATVAYALACVESRGANKVEALEWLGRAAEWGYADADVALWDEDLARLREESKFSEALTRMRSAAAKATGETTWAQISDSRAAPCESRVLTTDASGKYAVVARPEAVLQLLDAKNGHELRISSGKLWGDAVALVFHPDGKEVFSLTSIGKLQAWRISGESDPTELDAKPVVVGDLPFGLDWHTPPLLRVDRKGDRLLAIMGPGSGTSLVATRGGELHHWRAAFALGEGGVVAWRPDFERIAWCDDTTIRFANGRTGEPLPEFIKTPSRIDSLAFSSDGSLLSTGHEDGCARLWNLAPDKPQLARRFGEPHTQDDLDVLSISPDGRWLAAGMSDTGIIDIWELATGKLARRIQGTGRGWGALREPFQWTADSRRLWACFPVPKDAGAELDESFPLVVEEPVACLRVGGADRALAMGHGGVFAFDPRSGACLWTRPDLSRPGEIIHCASGYFTTGLPSLDKISFQKGERLRLGMPLEKLATRLFDPKRVRAARDGIEIIQPQI
ncbi:MAG: hypothetical protein ABI054_00275 [Planctomycetota bacterium]